MMKIGKCVRALSVVTDFWIRADGDSPRFPPGFCKARSPLVVTTLKIKGKVILNQQYFSTLSGQSGLQKDITNISSTNPLLFIFYCNISISRNSY